MLPFFSSIWQFCPLKEQSIPMLLNEIEQTIFDEMSRLYCNDAKATQQQKEAANMAYYKAMRRNGLRTRLRLLKLPDTMTEQQLTPKTVQQAIQAALPMLYIAVGNQKYGLSKVTSFAELFVRKSLQSILFFYKTNRFTMMSNIPLTVPTN
jgi:hypothetical protein